MQIYLITDTHFGHKALIERFGSRPADFEMRIVHNWHSTVGADDMVIHLGDVIVGEGSSGWTETVRGLPGRKVLVHGNHDAKSHLKYMENGYSFSCLYFSWHMFGHDILFSHEPVPEGPFDLNIHGHLHAGGHREERLPPERHFLLSLEEEQYTPVPLEAVVNRWRKAVASR